MTNGLSDLGVPDTIFGKFAYAALQQGIDFPRHWLWIAPTPEHKRIQFFRLRAGEIGFQATDLLDEVLGWDEEVRSPPY